MIESTVSSPMKSPSSSGPIGWLAPRCMAVSMASTGADAFVEGVDRLVDHRHQDTVDDEGGEVLGVGGGLAERFGEIDRRLVGRDVCGDAADDLDQLPSAGPGS